MDKITKKMYSSFKSTAEHQWPLQSVLTCGRHVTATANQWSRAVLLASLLSDVNGDINGMAPGGFFFIILYNWLLFLIFFCVGQPL